MEFRRRLRSSSDDRFDFYPTRARAGLSASGTGRFLGDDVRADADQDWQRATSASVDTSKWEEIAVPWSLSVAYAAAENAAFQGAGWYKRDFQIRQIGTACEVGWRSCCAKKVRRSMRTWLNGLSSLSETRLGAIERDVTPPWRLDQITWQFASSTKGGYRHSGATDCGRGAPCVCAPVHAQLIRVALGSIRWAWR